jgi:hypothetical protein
MLNVLRTIRHVIIIISPCKRKNYLKLYEQCMLFECDRRF